ncbi:NADH-binding protein, partial [candidate division KSB1 bacterium]|nr:NADH-binding protein [candidate division KSB1 bacterium]NIS27691.1 NADH-binding protein [candidate division KSB1 bacterium]NIT74522.1 NADH-binding protein [candidate division KSB1 bacterium]NIU28344.1 NADH-binding protein [candidate division KSB1 bacterium]NIU91553.1 NADH-binding protein [candidate division KSB1 bacterium]
IEVTYYLIHGMGDRGDFAHRDAQSARNFAAAAAKAGVKRIIYLGGLGNENQQLSEHLKSRNEVGQILGETGIPVTELRASIIIGSGGASFEIIRDLVKKLPLMITPRWVNSRCQPIGIGDVLKYLIGLLEAPRTPGRVFDIGGEEILTYSQMMREVAEVMGKRLYLINVPVLTPRLSAYWLNLVTTVPMSVAYPLIDGLRNDTICADNRIRDLINFQMTPFREAVQQALDEEGQLKVESRWTEASMPENV